MTTMRRGMAIRRRQLGQALRYWREHARKSAEESAVYAEVSRSTLIKMELGQQEIKPERVKLLGLYYAMPTDKLDELVALAREGKRRGWWSSFGKLVPKWFSLYLGLEGDAEEIWTYDAELVHGLLQTEAYMRAVIIAAEPDIAPKDLDRVVELRHARQSAIQRSDPVRLDWIVNEAALRRIVGSRDVMREQIDHILHAAESPHVTVRLLPFTTGAHPAMESTFTMLRMPGDKSPSLIYVETLFDAVYPDKPTDIHNYGATFESLQSAALTPEESTRAIATLKDEL